MLKTEAIFQRGMILQRNKPVVIWGSGEPGGEVQVSIQGKSADSAESRYEGGMPGIPEEIERKG